MKQLIDKLRHKHSLTGEEYAILLTCQDADTFNVSPTTGPRGYF